MQIEFPSRYSLVLILENGTENYSWKSHVFAKFVTGSWTHKLNGRFTPGNLTPSWIHPLIRSFSDSLIQNQLSIRDNNHLLSIPANHLCPNRSLLRGAISRQKPIMRNANTRKIPTHTSGGRARILGHRQRTTTDSGSRLDTRERILTDGTSGRRQEKRAQVIHLGWKGRFCSFLIILSLMLHSQPISHPLQSLLSFHFHLRNSPTWATCLPSRGACLNVTEKTNFQPVILTAASSQWDRLIPSENKLDWGQFLDQLQRCRSDKGPITGCE